MAQILRSGPFANSVNYFLNEPETPTTGTVPVNCANYAQSTSWAPRRFTWVQNNFNPVLQFYTDLGELQQVANSSSEDSVSILECGFRYQASNEFNLQFSYSLSASSSSGGNCLISMFVIYSGMFVSVIDSFSSGSESASGSYNFTLPSRTLPDNPVTISLTARANGSSSIQNSAVSLQIQTT